MADVAIVLALVGSSIALALGVAVLPRRLRAVIDATRPNPDREEAFMLQASVEVCNLAADREIADRENAISMLDQQSMSEDCCDASHWSAADEQAYQALRADSAFMRSVLREATRG